MSRRKQSKPRQIKRSIGDLDGGEETTPGDLSLSGEEGGASDQEDSAGGDGSSPLPFAPLYNEEPRTQASRGAPDEDEDDDDGDDEDDNYCDNAHEEEEGEEGSGDAEEPDRNHREPRRDEHKVSRRRASDDLDLGEEGEEPAVVTRRDLRTDTSWGPFPGIVQSEESSADELDMETEGSRLTLVCEDSGCWLNRVPVTPDATAANCTIYSRGEQLFCMLSRELVQGDRLLANLSTAAPPLHSSPSPTTSSSPPLDRLPPPTLAPATQNPQAVKEEHPSYPAAMHSEIQLLPQQAGMAAILATAVINKDIFPCKDCGIWYRSERNLQAHLMYYCASRQKQQPAAAPVSPPLVQDKPKETYPNERICPFPQCNKSCPSASSLEIHMRTHSGERPFVCLVCLSAFTTKANCERHLKVHTDTLTGVCHGCGFISTTRDILYSHLVTSHMVCQPGSRSEVYSPGPGMPNLPLATGLSPGDSGVVLKCQLCGHNCDNPAQLQQHVRTHLEVRVQAERSPTPRQSHPSSAADRAQLQPSPRGDREPPACVPRPDSSSPGANGGSATPRGYSPPAASPAPLRIKEEPRSDSEEEEQQRMDVETGEGGGGEKNGGGQEEEEGDQCSRKKISPGLGATSTSQTSTSPKSPSVAAMKAEPTSPTPGSSPAPVGAGASVLPGGAVFLPQYMFNAEAAILPQASEILAKMSEMVHSRLKQGQAVLQGNPAAFYPAGASPAAPAAAVATPPHKGATCFECDITFNNINNFYVHKRLYCSSRHQADCPGAPREAAPGAPPSSGGPDSSSPPQGRGSRAPSASPTPSDPPAGSGASEGGRLADIKTEAVAPKEGVSSSSEGEGGGGSVGGGAGGGGGGAGGRHSEDSHSPASGSADDRDDDPTKTFCEACNIRFSRHDNYTVHKRFYCASRHDPSNLRSNHPARLAAGSTPFVPQPIRTRKRKKMYEIHMARTEALAKAAAAALAASAPSPSALGLAVKRELSPGAASASSPEGDRPIDLSKRPRLRETPRGGGGGGGILPALPLTDYHKCTACSISFNSIENYLAHKTYYCPATTLQPHTLEQLSRLKQRPASTSPQSRPLQERDEFLQGVEAQTGGGTSSPQPASALPGSEAASSQHASTPSSGAKGLGAVCPYCPSRPIAGSLVEHFRSFHGMLLTLPTSQDARASPSPSLSLSPKEGGRPAAASASTSPDIKPRPASRLRRDSVNGQARQDNSRSPASPLMNGSPRAPGGTPPLSSPVALSPSRALSLTASPVPEALREAAGASILPEKACLASHPLPSPAAPLTGLPKNSGVSPVQNGNSRFCRLCNIKFSSLSTFIAHKKYYCSSHSAEHVK